MGKKLTAYERYQLEWMIEHGYSLKDLMDALDQAYFNADSLDCIGIPSYAFESFERKSGFDGEIYLPPEEFYERYIDSLARNAGIDTDDLAVCVTSSLHDVQAHSKGDDDGHAVLREAVQVTSHGRVVSNAVHERPVSIHGESTHARAVSAALAANMDAENEAEEKEGRHRER